MSNFSSRAVAALRQLGPIGINAANRIDLLTQRLHVAETERDLAERQMLDMSREISKLQRELATARTKPSNT